MAASNPLLEAPPYAVEDALLQLGQRLRTARLRRNLSVAEVGKKIGAGSRAVADAEKGKPSTGVAIYVALLWAFDLLNDFEALAVRFMMLRAWRSRAVGNDGARDVPRASTMSSDGSLGLIIGASKSSSVTSASPSWASWTTCCIHRTIEPGRSALG
jgi:DNA-binding XRE family transcriptional regulator